MIPNKRAAALALGSLMLASCTAHRYEGRVAVLRDPDIEVVQTATEWGSCRRRDSPVPMVYRLPRPSYVLTLAHGERYWPQFLVGAKATDGSRLELKGPQIRELDSGVVDWLARERKIDVSHSFGDHDQAPPQPLVIEVLSRRGRLLGEERLGFEVLPVRCVDWVGL